MNCVLETDHRLAAIVLCVHVCVCVCPCVRLCMCVFVSLRACVCGWECMLWGTASRVECHSKCRMFCLPLVRVLLGCFVNPGIANRECAGWMVGRSRGVFGWFMNCRMIVFCVIYDLSISSTASACRHRCMGWERREAGAPAKQGRGWYHVNAGSMHVFLARWTKQQLQQLVVYVLVTANHMVPVLVVMSGLAGPRYG